MNPKLVVKGINGIIEGGVSVTDFSVICELDEINAKELLYTLVQNGIGNLNDDVVDFGSAFDLILLQDAFVVNQCHSIVVQLDVVPLDPISQVQAVADCVLQQA